MTCRKNKMNGFSIAAINRIWVLIIAAAVDLLIGDPHWLWHPVQGVGTLITASEKLLRAVCRIPPEKESVGENTAAVHAFRVRERIAGAQMVLLVLAGSTGLTVLLFYLCGRIHPYLRILAEGILCGRLLALRSLGEAGFSVRDPLLRGDVEGARRSVSMIVGRDTKPLDAEGIAKAAVETVAENTSDGVTAPLFYMILFGGIGGIFYKAVNTMDSMTGYRNDRYRYFGTAAARLDDIMNFIPARLTALFMVLACCLPGKESVKIKDRDHRLTIENMETRDTSGNCSKSSGEAFGETLDGEDHGCSTVMIPDAKAAYRIWKRDRLKSPSPNSAQTESVCAGALHLRLLGDTWYFGELHHKAEIGDGGRPVQPEDITRSVRLMNRTAGLMFAAGIALLLFLFFIAQYS